MKQATKNTTYTMGTTKRVCTSPEAIVRKRARLIVNELQARFPHIYAQLCLEAQTFIDHDQMSLRSSVMSNVHGKDSQRVMHARNVKLEQLRAALAKTQTCVAGLAAIENKTKGQKK